MSDPNWEIDVRAHLIAAPGRLLGIVDLSQIEPRCLAWLCGDWDFLKLVETMTPYEAHARLYMGWTGGKLKKEDPKMYSLAKARVLALGYGAGWEKFIVMCTTYGIDPKEVLAGQVGRRDEEAFLNYLIKCKKASKVEDFMLLDDITQRIWVNSWLQVMDFREKNPKITKFWDRLEAKFKASLKDGTYEPILPSGRAMVYRDICTVQGTWKARVEYGGTLKHFYGGKLCENVTQACARDVFAEAVRRVEEIPIPVIFTVHDEAVTDLATEEELQPVIDAFSVTPKWLPGCPVAAEGHTSKFYLK